MQPRCPESEMSEHFLALRELRILCDSWTYMGALRVAVEPLVLAPHKLRIIMCDQ